MCGRWAHLSAGAQNQMRNLKTTTLNAALLAASPFAVSPAPTPPSEPTPPPRAADVERSRCDPRGAARRSRQVIITFRRNAEYYGCFFRRGVAVYLGKNDDTQSIAAIRLAGPWVAYYAPVSSVSARAFEIRVVNLQTGRRRYVLLRSYDINDFRPETERAWLYELALASNGAVAWIDEVRFPVPCPTAVAPEPQRTACLGEPRTELRSQSPSGYRVLDSGPGVNKNSLQTRGTRAYWRRDGQGRSASLR